MDTMNLDTEFERIKDQPAAHVGGVYFHREFSQKYNKEIWTYISKNTRVSVYPVSSKILERINIATESGWFVLVEVRPNDSQDKWSRVCKYPVCYIYLEAALVQARKLIIAERFFRLAHAVCLNRGHMKWQESLQDITPRVCTSSGHAVWKGVARLQKFK